MRGSAKAFGSWALKRPSVATVLVAKTEVKLPKKSSGGGKK